MNGFTCSPMELKRASGVSRNTMPSTLSSLNVPDIKSGISAIRARWVEVHKLEKEFSVLVGQMMLQPTVPSAGTLCAATLQLLKLGFRSLLELDSANALNWKMCNPTAKLYIISLCSSVGKNEADRVVSEKMNKKMDLVLTGKPRDRANAATAGPVASIKRARLDDLPKSEVQARLDNIAIETAITSVERSVGSYRSGVRAYILFYGHVVKGSTPFPPLLNVLLLYCTYFKNAGTLANYLTHAKWFCEAIGACTLVFGEPLLRRAKACIKAITLPKLKKWIQRPLLLRLMTLAIDEGDLAAAGLYALTYGFLGRMASEILPLTIAGQGVEANQKSKLYVLPHEILIVLAFRKNEIHESTIIRRCSCGASRQACLVHSVSKWLKTLEAGSQPFAHWSPAKVLAELRRRLRVLEIADPDSYGLHSFRRGAAQDMAAEGASIVAIMLAGGWRSNAFLIYLRKQDLCTVAATRLLADESDSEGEQNCAQRHRRTRV